MKCASESIGRRHQSNHANPTPRVHVINRPGEATLRFAGRSETDFAAEQPTGAPRSQFRTENTSTGAPVPGPPLALQLHYINACSAS